MYSSSVAHRKDSSFQSSLICIAPKKSELSLSGTGSCRCESFSDTFAENSSSDIGLHRLCSGALRRAYPLGRVSGFASSWYRRHVTQKCIAPSYSDLFPRKISINSSDEGVVNL